MTNEEIKQNAWNYANEDASVYWKYNYNAYIAGAHSRDEEINELEKKVSALETIITTARATIFTQEEIIKDLK